MRDISYIANNGVAYPGREVSLRVSNSNSSSVEIDRLYIENYLQRPAERNQFVFFFSTTPPFLSSGVVFTGENYTVPYTQTFLKPPENYLTFPYSSNFTAVLPASAYIEFKVIFVPITNGTYSGKLKIKTTDGALFIINLTGSKGPEIEEVDNLFFGVEVELLDGLGTLEIDNLG